ncbi:hypothetical protein Bbelb_407320 [Branchiostoma belcheri]|nr:hypothetical protein Bbelb_407320 [Branchiostoma belcheri]
MSLGTCAPTSAPAMKPGASVPSPADSPSLTRTSPPAPGPQDAERCSDVGVDHRRWLCDVCRCGRPRGAVYGPVSGAHTSRPVSEEVPAVLHVCRLPGGTYLWLLLSVRTSLPGDRSVLPRSHPVSYHARAMAPPGLPPAGLGVMMSLRNAWIHVLSGESVLKRDDEDEDSENDGEIQVLRTRLWEKVCSSSSQQLKRHLAIHQLIPPVSPCC